VIGAVASYRREALRRVRALRLVLTRARGKAAVRGPLRFGAHVTVEVDGRLELGRNVHLDDSSAIIVAAGARVAIGDDFYLGRASVVAAEDSVEIGSSCMIGEHVSIRDSDHRLPSRDRRAEREGRLAPRTSPIVIGNEVWVGAGARVLRGVHIASGAVVGANAVVREDVPPNVLVTGVPAAVVRSFENSSATE
jgi:acetyltransferase-like isoleucine patch superfamily enzyme